jgi:16S rRNA processing protein RimM
VDDIAGAQSLAGAEILVPEDDLPSLPDDTYLQRDLVGCVVVTVAGREVGPVAEVLSAGESEVLVVRPEGRAEILIPFSREICRKVDPAARLIVIDPPDGLLDLNEI